MESDKVPHTCQYIEDEVNFKGCPVGGCGVKAPAAMATSAVFRAKLSIRAAEEKLIANPEHAFNDDFLLALGILKNRSSAEFGKVMTRVKELTGNKLNIRHLESAVDENERRLIGRNRMITYLKDWNISSRFLKNW